MSFHLGKPILVMMILSLVCGAWIVIRESPVPGDLVVWVFADSHARSYRDPVQSVLAADVRDTRTRIFVVSAAHFRVGDRLEFPGPNPESATVVGVCPENAPEPWLEVLEPLKFSHRRGDPVRVPSLVELHERAAGRSVAVSVISARALDVRLISLFNSLSKDVPDLVEVEIGSVGKFFRPPVGEVGFLPLNRFIERDGIMDQMVRTRFAPWSKQGVVFGVPHDLHPVTITYRKDLFDLAGVDIASAKTWDQFQDLCLQFQAFWAGRGVQGRRAIELPSAASDYLVVMLLQRGINVVDDYNQVHLDDPKVADTVARYALMVAGPRRIAADATPGGELYARDLAHGDLCALITPDWRAGFLYAHAADMAGRLAMMPLPRFDPTDAPTSTWGGTMMGIPRAAKDAEASWQLLKRLYLSGESLNARQRFSKIIPPVRDQWKDVVFHIPDPFFSNQRVDELYIELADQIPPRYVTAFTPVASLSLNMVLANAVEYVKRRASEPRDQLEAGLRAACRKWLDDEEATLRKRIDFGKFE